MVLLLGCCVALTLDALNLYQDKEHVAILQNEVRDNAELEVEDVSENTQTTLPLIEINPKEENELNYIPEIMSEPEEPYVIAWISDTQGYTAYRPEIFNVMTNWIVENVDDMNIQYVIHTGDIVDTYNDEDQWENAINALSVLDDVVPLFTVAGNHDINSGEHKYEFYLDYFDKANFSKWDSYGDSYKGGRGRYDLIDINGEPIILISVGYSVVSADIEWINKMLHKYSDRSAILCFHGYMDTDESYTSDGKILYPEVVAANKNVKLVLCGHRHGINHNSVKFDDDGDGIEERTVYQLLFNYQGVKDNGGGYLCLLSFDGEAKEISVKSYSPYYDDYNYYDNSLGVEEFVIPWE